MKVKNSHGCIRHTQTPACTRRAFVLSVFFELVSEPGTDKVSHNERQNKCGVQFDSSPHLFIRENFIDLFLGQILSQL